MKRIPELTLPPTNMTERGENPEATSLFNLINRGRLDQINKLSAQLELEPDDVPHKRFGLGVDELSNAGADEIIEILLDLLNVRESHDD